MHTSSLGDEAGARRSTRRRWGSLSTRASFVGWVLLIATPLVVAAVAASGAVRQQAVDRAQRDLLTVLRLDVDRIETTVDALRSTADALAADIDDAVRADAPASSSTPPASPSTSSASSASPALLRADAQRRAGIEPLAVTLLDAAGDVTAASGLGGAVDERTRERALAAGAAIVGPTRVHAEGDHRFAVVAPLDDGFLVIDVDLATITDPLAAHASLGDSTVATLVEQRADGTVETIGQGAQPLSASIAAAALAAPQGRIIEGGSAGAHTAAGTADDTQTAAAEDTVAADDPAAANTVAGVDTAAANTVTADDAAASTEQAPVDDVIAAVQSIDGAPWGLAISLERDEALAPSVALERWLRIGATATVLATFIGWAMFYRPVAERSRRTAAAARNVALGRPADLEYDDIDDTIGDVARSIRSIAQRRETEAAARLASEAKLREQARRDCVTGLANRAHAQTVIDQLAADGYDVTVLFIDLLGLQGVNDAHGHAVGDEVLVSIGQRLSASVAHITNPIATVARWGGSQFLVLCPNVGTDGAPELVDYLSGQLHGPLPSSAGLLDVECRVGHAVAAGSRVDRAVSDAADQVRDDILDGRLHDVLGAPTGIDAPAPTALVDLADEASRRMQRPSTEAVQLVTAALQDNRVEVWYQPIVRATKGDDRRLAGVEALVRLRNPAGDIIPPAAFIDHIEGDSVSAALDRRVAAVALADFASWRDRGLITPGVRMAINVGGEAMQDRTLAATLLGQAHQLRIPPHLLIVELCERIVDVNMTTVAALRSAGLGVAIDDVGLRMSNFDRVVATRATIAKIDRKWIEGASRATGSDERIVLPRMIEACRELGMAVIAEGVERAEQLDELIEFGVELFQGFLFDTAHSRDSLEAVLSAERLVWPTVSNDPIEF